MSAPFSFVLPDELSAKEPPEQRGIPRDAVRLMVIDHLTKAVNHTQFNQPSYSASMEIALFSIWV
jgi:S-adenosylmethionine:tRNA ribosyltransferase-isomerase